MVVVASVFPLNAMAVGRIGFLVQMLNQKIQRGNKKLNKQPWIEFYLFYLCRTESPRHIISLDIPFARK